MLSDEHAFEVGDIVHSPDHHPAVALFDLRDGCVLDLEWKQAAARPAHDPMQRDLYDPAVSHDEHIATGMLSKDFIQSAGDPCLEQRSSLPSGHDVPIGLVDPARPCFGITLRYLVGIQAFPLTEKDLAQRKHRLRPLVDQPADHLGSLKCALQVARVKTGEGSPDQPRAEELGLAAALLRKRRIELALNPVLEVPRRLSVADQEEARWCWTRW